jgi:hypothetical protein
LEERLSNPLPPNDKLKQAAEKYKENLDKETQKEALIEIIKNDEELGLYEEPFENPLIKEPESELEIQEVEEPIVNERTQLQKLEDYVNPPQNNQEEIVTTNDEVIPTPSNDEISNWDETVMDELEEETVFQEEPTIEEEVQNFSTIEEKNENIFQEEPTPDFEVPEQEGWTEEKEQQFWEEQVPEPFATPEEVEKFKIDISEMEEPEVKQTIIIDEEKFKPFEVDLKIETPAAEPSFEVTAEKKNL